jgi:hypothetical protein
VADTLLVLLFVSLCVNVIFIRAWWSERRVRKAAERLMNVKLGRIAERVQQ